MLDKNATVIINLNELGFDKDVWWSIKKAVKSDLIVEPSEDFDSAIKILNEVLVEGGTHKANLENLKKNNVQMFTCSKDNKIIGMVSIMMRNGIPTLNYLASLKEYNSLCPNYLLVWHCILWANACHHHLLDLGGYQINARNHLVGINKFKEQWGNVYYYEENYPFLKAIGRKIIRNNSFFWWLNKFIKGKND